MTVRLVGGASDAEGRVEVNYEGAWGTVCNDSYWGFNDAMVFCRMLGYTSAVAAHVQYGPGTGSVLMSELACTGSESSISECPHRGWGETSIFCPHTLDAGITCGDGKCCLPHNHRIKYSVYFLNGMLGHDLLSFHSSI